MSIYQILESSGLTPGPPQHVEGASAAEALDNWARGRGFANYGQAAEVTGCAKIAYECPPEETRRPKCWRTVHQVHIRPGGPTLMRFGAMPNFDGCLSECREFARDQALNLNLPVIEAPGVNPDLAAPDFEKPAIYICAIQFDELAPDEMRVFRRR
jgi:hypothetical protein